MPVYLLQQAENRAEYQEDSEKKKQKLYAEIDSFQIKDKTQINTLKKFLTEKEIWSLEDMDYPLRASYEQYLKEKLNPNNVLWNLRIYDAIKQQHIYQQIRILPGKRFYEWRYQNQIFYLKYYPDQQIAKTFKYVKNPQILVWDFKRNCSETLKRQIFNTLELIITSINVSEQYRNRRLQALKILYDSCVRQKIVDIGLLEMEQFQNICLDFEKLNSKASVKHLNVIGTCRKNAFMQQEHIQWEATVWYLERLHLSENRIDKSKSLNSISFMEVQEKQNREILQAYMKYEIGVTGQALSTINRRFACIKNFLKILEQRKKLAIHATAEDLSIYAKNLQEHNVQAKGFNERIYSIGHFYKFMEVREYIAKIPFHIEYFQQKVITVHHDRSVEENVYMEVLKKLYLFPERLRCMFLHLWCLGLRASEVCTLKGNAYYQQGEDYWIQVYQVKMKNYKKIPIPKALYQLMKIYLKKYDIQANEYIFKNEKGDEACQYSTFRRQFLKACIENKIANGEYIFKSHDYRHTVATMFYDNGVSIQSIRDYLGHTYEEMTRQYIDFMPKKIAQANDKFFNTQESSLASWLRKGEEDAK